MNKTGSEASAFVRDLVQALPACHAIDLVLAPPFTALAAVRAALPPSSSLALGAQNLHWEDHGAYTGEVSAPMLRDAGCRYVIIGHSERRTLFGERDDGIRQKIRAALRHGVRPLLCIGESWTEREQNATEQVLTRQLTGGLAELTASDLATLTIAYEPVWAIGTGKAATPDQATTVHRTIRRFLSARWSPAVGDTTRIVYGGSVTPQNIEPFLKSPDIDGALVGGACLQIESFVKIVAVAESIGVAR